MAVLPITTFALFFLLLVSPRPTSARPLPNQAGEKFMKDNFGVDGSESGVKFLKDFDADRKLPPMFIWSSSPKVEGKEGENVVQTESGVKFLKDFVVDPKFPPKQPFIWNSSPKVEGEVESGKN